VLVHHQLLHHAGHLGGGSRGWGGGQAQHVEDGGGEVAHDGADGGEDEHSLLQEWVEEEGMGWQRCSPPGEGERIVARGRGR